jgi:3-hydroxyacyl-CoA dehydrogenase
MYIYKAGVVGGGAMGAEIAQVISYSGLPVVLVELNMELAEKAAEKAKKIYQNRVSKGKMTESELENKMALITVTDKYEDLADVDIVIEAVPEHLKIKEEVYKKLDAIVQPEAIFVSNTSALSITKMASFVKRSGKFAGMHFFNPAHVMKLVEVIPGLQTDEEVTQDVVSFAESLRKIPVIVQECAGFLVNRLLMPYLNEAVFALQEGAVSPEEIDKAMTDFGLPMGPASLADMLGLDVCTAVADILYDFYGDRMKPAEMLRKMMEAGRLGTKAEKGFYTYPDGGSGELVPIIEEVQKETGVKGTEFSTLRLMLPMVNEAVICLQEKVASARDIDIAMMAGTGFPRDKEGPLHYADEVGLDKIVEEMEKLKGKFGMRFHPAPMLKRMVAAGYLGKKANKGFFDYL